MNKKYPHTYLIKLKCFLGLHIKSPFVNTEHPKGWCMYCGHKYD
jgi:hypothetical protein